MKYGFLAILSISSLFYLSGVRADQPHLTPRTQLSQHGITWEFDRAVPVGQFVNGDYYVVGAVTIVAMKPAPQNGRHGSMVNPTFSWSTGYDSRVQGYDPTLAAQPPFALQPGDTLISSISHDKQERHPNVLDGLHIFASSKVSVLKSAAVLTILDRAVPPDTFRPSYVGPTKLFYAQNLRRDILPGHTCPPSTPDIAAWANVFQRPWLDHHLASWVNRELHPTDNMPDYGRDISSSASIASLLLMCDFSLDEKESLLINFIQWGLDVWGMAVDAGPDHGWEAMGGHGNGRKWPMIFAGLMFNDEDILSTKAIFSEDQQGRLWNRLERGPGGISACPSRSE